MTSNREINGRKSDVVESRGGGEGVRRKWMERYEVRIVKRSRGVRDEREDNRV